MFFQHLENTSRKFPLPILSAGESPYACTLYQIIDGNAIIAN